MLFVKLHQFTAADTQRVVMVTRAARWRQGLVPGLAVLPLHEHGPEHVAAGAVGAVDRRRSCGARPA